MHDLFVIEHLKLHYGVNEDQFAAQTVNRCRTDLMLARHEAKRGGHQGPCHRRTDLQRVYHL